MDEPALDGNKVINKLLTVVTNAFSKPSNIFYLCIEKRKLTSVDISVQEVAELENGAAVRRGLVSAELDTELTPQTVPEARRVKPHYSPNTCRTDEDTVVLQDKMSM